MSTSPSSLPTSTRCLVLTKIPSAGAELDPSNAAAAAKLNDTSIKEKDLPPLGSGDVLVRIVAAAFNHRELWQKKNSYPGIADGSVMGCDGAASGQGAEDVLLHKRVFLTPAHGWKSDPDGPEGRFGTVGGGAWPPIGTMTEYVVVDRDEVIEVPEHLSFEEAAAWPCCGITAWRWVDERVESGNATYTFGHRRAMFVKGALKAGQNVLITGAGGGVALQCLQLAVAAGANVYVTSGDQAKIDNAVSLGARGGVIYKNASWPAELGALLKTNAENGSAKPLLDLVIDQGGGDICAQTSKIIKNGGIISCFGMHGARGINFTMREVLKNIELKGSTLGSQKELEEATQFIAQHKIKPIISEIIEGLDDANKAFDLLQKGTVMGKIVVRISSPEGARL
ncbi:hypothetical protein FRC00_007099 [Tulasnella sp. 408]|nr:hypothetical protein FRC00_007099 [Tulasnella sp. 408]